MRPLPGSSVLSRSASAGDGATDSLTSQSTAPQMSYILADEASVDASLLSPCHHHPPRSRDQRKHPIYNLLGDSPAPSRESSAAPPPLPSAPRPSSTLQPREHVQHRPINTISRSPTRLQTPPPTAASQPMTPILYGVSGPCSAISSSSSRRNSLAGSLSEYQESFIMSAFGASESGQPPSSSGGEGAQQFIMPTINVPSRRPFTDVGKSLGRLKLLVAGKSGLGKSSLIKAITHSCEHIVHVDPTTPVAMASTGLLPTNALPSDPPMAQGTFQITETFASTKPYPSWWKESTQPSCAFNSGSAGDVVLDRNICLVDTPGYQETCRPSDTVGQVSQYVGSHLHKNRLDGLSDAEVLKTIDGSGGLLVDAVFYMIRSSGLTPTDLQYLRQLQPLTNVIPLLAHADTLTTEEVAKSKELITRQLTESGLDLLSFASLGLHAEGPAVYAISSEMGTDRDVMDASLLMSPEYVQPLVPTDLSHLLSCVFSLDGAGWLRHNAAKKLISWRSRYPIANHTSSVLNMQFKSSTETRLLRTRSGPLASLTMTRAPSYAVCEERFCRLQFTNWAADLERSLTNQRAMQERRAREQAATWIRETWGEGGASSDGRHAPMTLTRTRGRGERLHAISRRNIGTGSDALVRDQDPLGLLQLRPEFRWQRAFEMVGGIGLLGGIAWLLV